MQFEWDHDDEQDRERRLQERRQRVQERLAAQKQGGPAAGEGDGSGSGTGVGVGRGQQEAALALEAVGQLRGQCDAAAAAVREAAEQREDARRDQWDQQVSWLRGEIATEAESCRQHARAIDLEWEAVHNAAAPQVAHDAMLAVRAHCDQVLQSKADLLAGIQGVLKERDAAYVRLLQRQGEETDALVALMAQEYGKFRRGQEAALEAVEAAYLQERSELISAHKLELDGLLEKRSGLEQSFLDQYLKACEAYEAQLQAMRVAESEDYAALKRRLESEVASLEAHLDAMRSVYMLNADKLQYNVRVLLERERESKEALQQQKRKVTRQWEVLSKLKKRFAALDRQLGEENQRLGEEYRRVARAFHALQAKARRSKEADRRRCAQVRAMKEEEVEQLAEALAEADAVIRQHVLGLPPSATAAELAGEDGAASGDEAGESQGSAPGSGLMVVGRAVTAGREVGLGQGPAAGEPEQPEVLVLPGEEAAEQGQLIAAFRPSTATTVDDAAGPTAQLAGLDVASPQSEAIAGVESETAAGSGAPPLPPLGPAVQRDLQESVEAGVLSLLCGPSGRLDPGKLLRLLRKLPEAALGRWEPACVARGLGLQLEASQQVVVQALLGAREDGGSGSDVTCAEADAAAAAEGSAAPGLVAAEQVQRGLQRLLCTLQGCAGEAGAAVGGSSGKAVTRVEEEAYWAQRVQSVLPLPQAWALLEPQLARRLKLLQRRSREAEEVAALARENEVLKGRLKQLLTSPANDELQLPTRLLLQ